MKNKKRDLLLLIVGLIIVIASIMVYSYYKDKIKITNFTECESAGYPVMESYPRQCSNNDVTFTEDIGNRIEKEDLIRVTLPVPNQLIASPLNIQGEARGYWFFEGSFPIIIKDGNGKVLLKSFIDTKDQWMTEDFISFDKKFEFNKPETDTGEIILYKANPSGLNKNDDQLIIPVRFYSMNSEK